MATYKWLSRRLRIVPNMLIPKTTHTNVIRISIGQANSAYSLLVVMPIGRLTAAHKMTTCQPQKCIQDSLSLHMRAFSSRWSE
jgi:hypothetical protein